MIILTLFCTLPSASLAATRAEAAIASYDLKVKKMKDDYNHLPEKPTNKPWVREKLKVMVDIDQLTRNLLSLPHKENYSPEETLDFLNTLSARMAQVDLENTEDLKHLLKIYNWFTISAFGPESDSRAWLLVQHADHDHTFQKNILVILEGLYKNLETNPRNYAYLFDRVAASWNDSSLRTLQRYGTQGMCTGPGTWTPIPMEDESQVDSRRASVGLGTMAEYKEMFKDICQ